MSPLINGYSIVLIPKSWAFGRWYRHKKTIFSFGPLRFVIHRGLGAWKPPGDFEPAINKGVWLKGPSPSEFVGDGSRRRPAGGALEPVDHKG